MSCNTILLVSLSIKQSCWKAWIFASNYQQHVKNMLTSFFHYLPRHCSSTSIPHKLKDGADLRQNLLIDHSRTWQNLTHLTPWNLKICRKPGVNHLQMTWLQPLSRRGSDSWAHWAWRAAAPEGPMSDPILTLRLLKTWARFFQHYVPLAIPENASLITSIKTNQLHKRVPTDCPAENCIYKYPR